MAARKRSDQHELQTELKQYQQEEEVTNGNSNGRNRMEEKRGVAAVVYYLSRNGQLEHPHFIEVPLSSSQGLFLRDVLLRLNLLRGQSLAFNYSWSSKRSYKSGYVWHDLEENDYIHPVHGGEYVLKGSEILEASSLSPSSPSSLSKSSANNSIIPSANHSFSRNPRRNQSWGSIDLHEYKVYKAQSTHDSAAADASTQTDDKLRRRKAVIKEEPEIQEEHQQQQSTELSRGEISPPPSDSSPETLETLMKADGRLVINSVSGCESIVAVDQATGGFNRMAENNPNGRMKASSVLMSLISCGSMSFRDCGATAVKDHGLSLISHYKPRMPRGWVHTVGDDDGMIKNEDEKNVSGRFTKINLEDKEYFSGSLVESNKSNYKEDHQSSLKRSSSYNADRSSHLKLEGKEMDGVRAGCIPRRSKAQPINKKECTSEITLVTINSTQNG